MTLMPLSEEIPNEARELAEELRRFFGVLNISIRRYATRCNYDPATVSRYFNGKRVPPWSFVQNLLAEVAEKHGSPVQQDVFEVIRKLHRMALEKSNKQLYEVEILQDKLARADKEYRLAELREKALLEAMQIRQQRIAYLENETLQINSSLLEERAKSEALTDQLAQLTPSKEELSRLRKEVQELREQLTRSQELTEQADARCKKLENQLQSAEDAAQAGQEARNQEELRTALQEAAEAKAVADGLREELERLRGESKTSTPQRRIKGDARTVLRDLKRRKDPFAERIAEQPAEEIAATLMKMTLTGREKEASQAMRSIGANFPVKKVGEVVIQSDKVSITLSRAILMSFGETRNPQEMCELITNFGSMKIDRESNVAREAIIWFSWDRPPGDLTEMMTLLKEANWGELATECLMGAARHQPYKQLVEFISRTEGERGELIEFTIASREAEKLIPIIARMRSSGYSSILDELLAKLEHSHPRKFTKVTEMLDRVGFEVK
ncbi:hypothetical protein [Streptomyces sp. NPDC017435]|uniref:hypothetical protein n=1 Tax=Streptomyces sp. NPDC017435 TaxID=3364995 RepID=UPI0037ADEA8E